MKSIDIYVRIGVILDKGSRGEKERNGRERNEREIEREIDRQTDERMRERKR